MDPILHPFRLLAIALALAAISCAPGSGTSDDQNIVAMNEELKLNKFDNVLELYEQNSASFGTNTKAEALALKAQSLERIARKLNTDPLNADNEAFRQNAAKKYRPYDIRLINGKFFYLGRDYLELARMDRRKPLEWYTRYLELNDPYIIREMKTTDTVNRFDGIMDDTIREMHDRKGLLSSSVRTRILVSLKPRILKVTALSNMSRRHADRMIRLCDALIDASPEKAEMVNSYFIKMSLSRAGMNREVLRDISAEMIKKYPHDRSSGFAWYLQANFAYKDGDHAKALDYYNKALSLLSDYTPGKYGFNEMLFYDFPDTQHMRQDIANRIGILRSDAQYQQQLKTADIAIIAGDTVRLRKTMDADSSRNIVTSLSKGEKVISLKRSQEREEIDGYSDYWYYVRTRNGSEGWIFGKYLIIF